MTRKEVREFIKTGIDALNLSISFNAGLITDFNKERSNTYPTAWLETVTVDSTIQEQGTKQDNFPIALHIAKLDRIDSSPEEYEQLIDDCDLIAQKLINQYDSLLYDDYSLVSIESYSREPFIKKHADCMTGVLLTFTLITPATTNVC